MRNVFSGNADILAVAAILLGLGFGSVVNLEREVVRANTRQFTRDHIAVFDEEMRKAERELTRFHHRLRLAACERFGGE